jgi:hypothetical protein
MCLLHKELFWVFLHELWSGARKGFEHKDALHLCMSSKKRVKRFMITLKNASELHIVTSAGFRPRKKDKKGKGDQRESEDLFDSKKADSDSPDEASQGVLSFVDPRQMILLLIKLCL